MPPKRVSLKGKGSDIFFGEYLPEDRPPPAGESASAARPDSEGTEEREQDDGVASTIASNPDSGATENSADDGVSKPAPRPPSPRPAAATPVKRRRNDAASEPASELAYYQAEMVERIRKMVKVPGREVSYVRLTAEEKAQLAKIIYGYRSRGKRTTENEINRIAVNFMLLDHQANGESSLLAQVIDALLA